MSRGKRLFRGKKITQTELETNLQDIIAGRSFSGQIGLIILIVILSILPGSLTGVIGGLISIHIVFPETEDLRFTACCVAIMIVVAIHSILKKGLIRGFLKIILATAITMIVIVSIVATGYLDAEFINAIPFFIAFAITLTLLSLMSAGLGLTLIFISWTKTRRVFQGVFTALFIGVSILSASLIIGSIGPPVSVFLKKKVIVQGLSIAVGVIFGGGVITSLMASHLNDNSISNPLLLIRQWAITLSTWGSTSFHNLDLSYVDFTGAQLANTDLRARSLYRTCFKQVKGLDRALVDNSYLDLENSKVQQLLVFSHSINKNFSGLNLQGVCLKDADLEEFNFTETNLNGADLRRANLRGAILVKAQLLGADLSGSCLTDICIQDWNINHKTHFKNVDCERVYIKQTPRGRFLEPKPDSGTFRHGEFERWVVDIQDTVDLIFQNGLNWRAFAFSLAQTAINHDALDLSIQSIENKGDGVVITKLAVNPKANKGQVHKEISTLYSEAIKAIKSRYELVLQAKEVEIKRLNYQIKEFYKSQQQFVQGLVGSIAETKGRVLIQGKGNRVYMIDQAGNIMENVNQNINAVRNIDMSSGARINIRGDVVASDVSLADRNSQVTNSIKQLKDIKDFDSNELAKILSILQEAISRDPILSADQKNDALDAVETLAEEGKKPPEKRMSKFCSMAVNALKGLTATVSDASNLAEALKTCLPTLMSLLSL